MEKWKIIPYEQMYEVSTFGRVRNTNTGVVKSLRKDRYGYLRVTLYPSGKTYTVHRLVATVWIEGQSNDRCQIDHIDNDKTNNSVENLEWVTPKENVNRIPVRGSVVGSDNGMSTISDQTAMYIKYSFDKSYKELISELGVSGNIIAGIRERKSWVHIVDSVMEDAFLSGGIKYKTTASANLDEKSSAELWEDLENGVYSTTELMNKYCVAKSTILRRKKKLKAAK